MEREGNQFTSSQSQIFSDFFQLSSVKETYNTKACRCSCKWTADGRRRGGSASSPEGKGKVKQAEREMQTGVNNG